MPHEHQHPVPKSDRADCSSHWADLARLLTLSQRSLQRLISDLGPSESEWVLLWVCSEAPAEGMPQVAFAESLGISPAQVSALVERLRERGRLESNRCPQDRRRRLWRLTDSGRQSLELASQQLAQRLAELPSPLDRDELASIRQRLESLIASLAKPAGRKARAA